MWRECAEVCAGVCAKGIEYRARQLGGVEERVGQRGGKIPAQRLRHHRQLEQVHNGRLENQADETRLEPRGELDGAGRAERAAGEEAGCALQAGTAQDLRQMWVRGGMWRLYSLVLYAIDCIAVRLTCGKWCMIAAASLVRVTNEGVPVCATR